MGADLAHARKVTLAPALTIMSTKPNVRRMTAERPPDYVTQTSGLARQYSGGSVFGTQGRRIEQVGPKESQSQSDCAM
jgi:hypothetical protein